MIRRTLHILLLRHGQTDANASGRLQGHQPTPLNLTGVRQAVRLADRLAGYRPPVEVLISSDLPRAMQTASPIAAACGLKLVLDPAWRERHFGQLEGKPVGSRNLWRTASGELDPPGAEPAAAMRQRILGALQQLPIRYRRANCIAVVTHGGPIRSVLRLLLDGSLPTARGRSNLAPLADELPSIGNCSILNLMARHYRDGVRWRLSCVNDSAHLEEASVAGGGGDGG
jgi:probable phosphoglycerate mutase